MDENRMYRTVYRRNEVSGGGQVYSESDSIEFHRKDLEYLRKLPWVDEAWIETRLVTPWERTDEGDEMRMLTPWERTDD